MFSELCRETLRKAAVCYSSGRSSASPSPSPPSSPPPSPSRETTSQQPRHHRHHHHCQQQEGPVETRSVGCYANHERDREPLGRLARRAIGTGEFCEKRPAAPTNVSSRRTSGLESRDGRRLPYAATTDYYFSDLPSSRDHQHHHHHHHHRHHHHHQYHRRHRHQYHQHPHIHHCHRRVRSASPEMLRSSGRQEPDEQQNYESSGSSSEPDDNSSGDEAGAVPDENSQRSNSAHNRHSLTKEGTMHWFARIGSNEDSIHVPDLRRRSSQFDEDSLDGDHPYEHEGRESTTGGNDAAAAANRTKEIDRARLVRERQNEERQRKLEELREQALAAQRFREQREEDRRRRIEELRNRDYDRRSQVEERKRMIWEAEHARREAILRKNQEREARIEAKRKNERSHIVFAFGSSTPRMLEPADTGGASFWGTRRATSTSNVMSFSATGPHQPLTRRSSERELDAGSKKRATSAGGLDRKPGEDMRMSSSMYEVFNWNCNPDPPLTPAKSNRASFSLIPTADIFSIDDTSMIDDAIIIRRPMIHRGFSGDEGDASVLGTPGGPAAVCSGARFANRRRTDLMPTIPSPRESSAGPAATSGRPSSAKSFARSPGRTYSMSRLDQLAQPRKRAPHSQQPAADGQQSEPAAAQPQHRRQGLAAASSMSRSMSHLAGARGEAHRQQRLQRAPQHRERPGPLDRAAGGAALVRSDNSRSMGTLPGPGLAGGPPLGPAPPRPTRAERLRRKAREHQAGQPTKDAGIRSGEATPSSPSRPHSSMSQQSATSSVASGSVSLRPRAPTPRRPRPASIAGTGVTSGTGAGYERNNAAEAKSQKDSSKPPLPAKLHGSAQPRKPSSGARSTATTTTTSTSTSTSERLAGVAGQATAARSARASPRITPRATPLQSPGAAEQQSPPEAGGARAESQRQLVKPEEKPVGPRAQEEEEEEEETKEAAAAVLLVEEEEEEKEHPGLEHLKQVAPKIPDSEPSVKDEAVAAAGKKEEQQQQPAAAIAEPTSTAPAPLDEAPRQQQQLQQQQQQQQQSSPSPAADKRAEKKLPAENEARVEAELDEQCDMTASMIQKIRITTEEEAKAALAERRRLAREQAEREAELERQRLEEEARLEAERLRAEEEEQRRLEEETLRLAQEAREAEEQRLRLAIEEAQKREEEDRKRREEEARQKLEKEEAERKAREEAEKQRLEMVERLKKEEAERNARRKRVEAIMSRTRAKNQPNTPNKGEGNDGEKSKEDSPSDESKPTPGEKAVQDLMTTSLISEATQQFITSEQRAHCAESNNAEESGKTVVRNGTHANGISEQSSTKPTGLDNDDNNGPQEFNGHHNNTNHGNGIGAQTIALDNATVKQNNATNNLLLDLADFDALGNSNGAGPILLMQPRSGGGGGGGVLVHEDSLNSNLNPTAMPFVPGFGLMPGATGVNAFQDAFAGGKQQDNQVTDLLS